MMAPTVAEAVSGYDPSVLMMQFDHKVTSESNGTGSSLCQGEIESLSV